MNEELTLIQKYGGKTANSSLGHEEWNNLISDLNPMSEVAKTLNSGMAETHITSKGNLEIETKNKTNVEVEEVDTIEAGGTISQDSIPASPTIDDADYNKYYGSSSPYSRIIASESPNINIESDSSIKLTSLSACVWDDVNVTADNFATYLANDSFGEGLKADSDPELKYANGKIYGITDDGRKKSEISMTVFDSHLRYVKCRQLSASGGVSIESDSKIKLSAPKVTLEGVTGFGSSMTFGETDEGIKYQYKATKKGKNKQCDIIQVEVYNNGTGSINFNPATHTPSNYEIYGVSQGEQIPTFCTTSQVAIPAGQKVVIAQASIYDIIKLVDYFKNGNQGPWAPQT